ncbi:MAG: hypothetical protein QW097_02320 [archaeon]
MRFSKASVYILANGVIWTLLMISLILFLGVTTFPYVRLGLAFIGIISIISAFLLDWKRDLATNLALICGFLSLPVGILGIYGSQIAAKEKIKKNSKR